MNHSPVKLFVEFSESVKQIEWTSATKNNRNCVRFKLAKLHNGIAKDILWQWFSRLPVYMHWYATNILIRFYHAMIFGIINRVKKCL